MRRVSLEAWLFALVLAVNLYAAITPANSLMMYWFSSDDAFYYFKTAQNISEGHGITFDGLARASGFHPLWMLVCVPVFALARFDLILPLRLIVVISGLLSAGTAVLLFRLARRALSIEAAFLTGLFFAVTPFIHSRIVQMGLESGLSAFFLVLLFERTAALIDTADQPGRLANKRAYFMLGLIASLTILARLDNIFFVLAAGAWVAVSVRPLPAQTASRVRATFALDIALIIFGALWSCFSRIGFGPIYAPFAASSYWLAALALVLRLPAYYLFGLYGLPPREWKAVPNFIARALMASGLASTLLVLTMLLAHKMGAFAGMSRTALIYEAVFALFALLAARLVVALVNLHVTVTLPEPHLPLNIQETFLQGLWFSLPIVILLGSYMLASQYYFGTASPVSGQIKRWWGTLPNPIYGEPVKSLAGFIGFEGRARAWELVQSLTSWPSILNSQLRLALYAILAGLIVWLARRRVLLAVLRLPLLPLFTGGFIQLISYTGTGYIHTRPWYWTGQMILITLLVGVFIDALLDIACSWLPKHFPSISRTQWNLQMILSGMLGACILLSGFVELAGNVPIIIKPENKEAYLGGVHNLEDSTEPGALVGSTGGGVIAYFVKDRTIVNMDGLMNSTEYFHMLQEGTAREYFDRIGLDYVYTGATVITDSDPYFQFKDNLLRLKDFPGITLFRWRHSP